MSSEALPSQTAVETNGAAQKSLPKVKEGDDYAPSNGNDCTTTKKSDIPCHSKGTFKLHFQDSDDSLDRGEETEIRLLGLDRKTPMGRRCRQGTAETKG